MRRPYIFAGEETIDVSFALLKLKDIFGIETLLLEGGSILNGAFQRAGVIDELSLVVAPVLADKEDKPLFTDGFAEDLQCIKTETKDGILTLQYRFEKGV